MIDTINALIIDGNQAGQVYEMTRAGRVFIEYADLQGVALLPHQITVGGDYLITQVLYAPHRVMMFDRELWIASCKPGRPPAAAVADALLNDAAKRLFAQSPEPPRRPVLKVCTCIPADMEIGMFDTSCPTHGEPE